MRVTLQEERSSSNGRGDILVNNAGICRNLEGIDYIQHRFV
jgi:hypothetical protein